MLTETSVSVIKTFTVIGERQIDTHAVTGAFVTLTVVDLCTNQRIFTVTLDTVGWWSGVLVSALASING